MCTIWDHSCRLIFAAVRFRKNRSALHALRGYRYKYIHYHGIWGVDKLYDLEADPLESQNLIHTPEHQPLYPDKGNR